MAKKVFSVMGASGQIGNVVVQELLNQGHQVIALGRDPKKLASLKAKGVEIFQCDTFENEEALIKAFKEAEGVFGLIPPGHGAEDYDSYQDRVGEAIKNAAEKSKVPYFINLSSMGASTGEGRGPINGLYRQEQRLKSLKNTHIIHLRPSYFMQNFLTLIPELAKTNALKTPLNVSTPFHLVSTEDIGKKAAEFLSQANFKGQTVFEFTGPREYTISETAKDLGKAIGKTDLKVVQQGYEDAKKQWVAAGLNPRMVDLLIEMYQAFNNGKCQPTQQMTAEHRGKITFEQFAETFAKAFKQTVEKQKVGV